MQNVITFTDVFLKLNCFFLTALSAGLITSTSMMAPVLEAGYWEQFAMQIELSSILPTSTWLCASGVMVQSIAQDFTLSTELLVRYCGYKPFIKCRLCLFQQELLCAVSEDQGLCKNNCGYQVGNCSCSSNCEYRGTCCADYRGKRWFKINPFTLV